MANIYHESDLIRHYNLKPCDRIVVPKSNIQLVQHHALYLGYDDYGNHWISENQFGRGVVLTRAIDFFRLNSSITRIERFSGSNSERKQKVQLALHRLGQPYNLISYNCEHFVNDVLKGRAYSSQVGNVAVLAGIGLLLAFALGGKK